MKKPDFYKQLVLPKRCSFEKYAVEEIAQKCGIKILWLPATISLRVKSY